MVLTFVAIILLIICACLINEKQFLFIPLFFIAILALAFIVLLFKFLTEPKIAIQADFDGIYFYYRNNKEIFINYKDINQIVANKSRNSYGGITIYAKDNIYRSIMIKEDKYQVISQIKNLINKDDKEKYLTKIGIK